MSVPLHKLQARLDRDLYLPFAFRVAFAATKLPWAKVAGDPKSCAEALRAFQRKIQADAVVPWFDGWLEAEAAGARVSRDEFGRVVGTPSTPQRVPRADGFLDAPQIRHVLEVTRLLCAETREQSSVIACVTGMRILAVRLLGVRPKPGVDVEPAAAEIARALARAYCEAGVGALVAAAELPMTDASEARHYQPVAEVAREYGVPMILLSRHPMSQALEAGLHKSGIDRVASPGGKDSVCALPAAMVRAAPDVSNGWFRLQRDAKTAPRLFVSDWELPVDASTETLIALRDKVVA
jgi:hypothetical protein